MLFVFMPTTTIINDYYYYYYHYYYYYDDDDYYSSTQVFDSKPVPAWKVDEEDVGQLPLEAQASGNIEEAARFVAVDFWDGTGPQPSAPDQV